VTLLAAGAAWLLVVLMVVSLCITAAGRARRGGVREPNRPYRWTSQ